MQIQRRLRVKQRLVVAYSTRCLEMKKFYCRPIYNHNLISNGRGHPVAITKSAESGPAE
jgi:hypothetical protein